MQKIEEEYGDKINISWRSYPLVLDENPERHFTPFTANAWRRAALEENINFPSWDTRQTYPTSSMPALQATKCAQLQGGEAFQRFHIALFKAFFEESRNISDRQVLLSLAKETGLDIERFGSDFDQGPRDNEIWAENIDIRDEYAGWGIPLVIIEDRYPFGGAVPIEMYRRGVNLCLSSQAA